MNLSFLPAHILREKIKKKEIKPSEIVKSCISKIKKKEKDTNAFISLFEEKSIKRAKKLDILFEKGKVKGSFFGITLAIKDNILIKDFPATCGSRILEDYIAPYDATVIKKLKRENPVFIGKTNMDEFGMGGSNEYSAFGAVSNPHNFDFVPGGSSGGSAAAVSSGMSICALGSDTGGSVRQPASFCGLVGLKPTYGRVSRYGLVAFASSLDQIGPITKDVQDAWELFLKIAGYDPKDRTSKDISLPSLSEKENFTIGIPEEAFGEGVNEEVCKIVLSAVQSVSREKKFTMKDIHLKTLKYSIPTYQIVACAEASSNLERYDGVKYGLRIQEQDLNDMYKKTRGQGFGPEVLRRIFMGGYVLRSGYYDLYYIKAQKVRRLILEDFKRAFEEVDVVITPTSPFPPFKKGERLYDPISLYLADVFTVSVNLAGVPAISIPCGKTSGGLPVGLQLIGKSFEEGELFKLSFAFEEVLNNEDKNRF